jgi:hypothetical protein
MLTAFDNSLLLNHALSYYLLFGLFGVLFVCKCVLPPGDNPIAVNKYIIIYYYYYYYYYLLFNILRMEPG